MNDEQLLRYSRHIFLPEVDLDGQQKIQAAKLLVIGLGGLGSAALPYLVGSGVGTITLVDDDYVELSNLPRQIIHNTTGIGVSKVTSAIETLQLLNPDVQLNAVKQRVDTEWLLNEVAQYDVILDCTDNAAVRYAINRAAIQHKVPWVSGAAIGMKGQITVFDPREDTSPCYRCLYNEVNQEQLSCSESGVLSPLVGVVGSLQAVEVLKTILQAGQLLHGRLLTYDALHARFNEWKVNRQTDCIDCASNSAVKG